MCWCMYACVSVYALCVCVCVWVCVCVCVLCEVTANTPDECVAIRPPAIFHCPPGTLHGEPCCCLGTRRGVPSSCLTPTGTMRRIRRMTETSKTSAVVLVCANCTTRDAPPPLATVMCNHSGASFILKDMWGTGGRGGGGGGGGAY